tara:strand:- start:2088 stop:2261 length:174 start_codon:yes stop_codon:yes gene_type:complete
MSFHIADDIDAVFERAIDEGRMRPSEVGMYMYMGTRNGVDTFKHVDTREYLPENKEN